MQALVVLLLFVGVVMVMHGVYEERVAVLEKQTRIEYRFVPRTYYDEQLAAHPDLDSKFGTMFSKESPWSERP